MKRKGKMKRILISSIAAILVLALGGGIFAYFRSHSRESVNVYPFNYFGMTQYWGDSQESGGIVTSDRVQTVYLSDTQTVKEVLVQPGDSVKKGDVLMRFDTTLSDLSLERKRLEVEKLKLQLEDAQEKLREINNMVPMVIPTPSPEPSDPETPDLGEPLSVPYRIAEEKGFDGSSALQPLICWIGSGTDINAELFSALLEKAQELWENSREPAAPPASEPGQQPEETTALAATQETEFPTEPSGENPAEPGTEPATEPDPEQKKTDFYVIFKTTQDDMSLGATSTWQGFHVRERDGGFTFRFFDASEIADPTLSQPAEPDDEPEINWGSGYTSAQIAQMRNEQEKTIKDLTFNIKMAEADYKIMQTEVSDGNVTAQFDGEVVSLLSADEAKMNNQPLMKISGGGGFYITGSVGELTREELLPGQEVTIQDWNTGASLCGTVETVGDYPTNSDGYYGVGNPNVSYYPFTVFVDGTADLMEGSYVSIQYSTGTGSENGIYLENPFLRKEGAESYVFVRGADGLLEKRNVRVGKSLWGSYTQILSGLSEDDLIAFPYGKNVMEGAETVEADPSELYSY